MNNLPVRKWIARFLNNEFESYDCKTQVDACLTLHEMHGFGKDRCAKVLNDTYDRMTMALNSDEAIQEVYDTMGLEIRFSNDIAEDAVEAM